VHISSLALLKMLIHGRAGVPMEVCVCAGPAVCACAYRCPQVMGLMLGDFVDDYTIRVVDVFAMPQSGELCVGASHVSLPAELYAAR
jgi:26S proteasome regulatory subunit N11